MFQVVVGHSDDPDSQNAIAEVLQECSRSLAGSLPQSGSVKFFSDILEQAVVQITDALVTIFCQLLRHL